MHFDSLDYPYASQRMVVHGKNGMVATSQHLAAQAGLEILKKGGNAVDAAIATAATLTVVEPTSNGLGGDAFAIVHMNGKIHGINSSGPAPLALNGDKIKAAGHNTMPKWGWIPVTVPGVPNAWTSLWKRFGKLPLADLMQPAIAYAKEGFPISPTLGEAWQRAFALYKKSFQGPEFAEWFKVFAPHGKAPEIGEMWKSEDHAKTLTAIAQSEGTDFYQGDIAKLIVQFARETGGFLTMDDLQDFSAEWVEPLRVNYRGVDVWELPPNGQGLVALIALNILNGWEFAEKDIETYHKQIEAMKLAMSVGKRTIADPKHMVTDPRELLTKEYADSLREVIKYDAIDPTPVIDQDHGTVYLATADGEGNMVSYIQSNYMGFGSGVVVPGTGIALQNRGANFSLDPQDANYFMPGKRSYHTIIPGFLTKDEKPIGPFGVMGGFMQPQGHLQVVMNTIDFGLNPQASLDAPRWQWMNGKTVELEHSVPIHIGQALARRGHKVHIPYSSGGFGRGQIIWRTDEGVLVGGTEPRTDGAVAAW